MPEWMDSWLKAPFYANKCTVHQSQWKPVFCGVCMGKPCCGICWDDHESKNHENHHPILRVRRASHRAAIGIEQMSGLWDVSNIEVYSINNIGICHLNPNPNPDNGGGDGHARCKTCTKKLKPNSTYFFCSIACKYYKNNSLRQGGEVDVAIEPNVVVVPPTAKLSLRKRKRKGTPTRSPTSGCSGFIDVKIIKLQKIDS